MGGCYPHPQPPEMSAVPFKANADRRHRIPKQQDRVTNWSEYDAALRQRGSLTVWFTEEAIAAWRAEPRTTRGGQPHYSALAITSSGGGINRPGFERLLAAICEGRVGAVFAIEASRLARNGRDWHTLIEFCGLVGTIIVDEDGIYDPRHPNDRLLLGMNGMVT